MRNVLDKSFRETQNTHFIFINIFRKSRLLIGNVEKHGITRQAANDNIARNTRFVCWINKVTDTHSYYEYLLLLHDNNCYINAPKCYVYTYIAYLV
jgi:hypothetical protein